MLTPITKFTNPVNVETIPLDDESEFSYEELLLLLTVVFVTISPSSSLLFTIFCMIFRLIFFVDDIRENASDIGIKQHNIFRILKRNIMEDIDSIVNKYELLLFIIMMMMMIEEREKKKIKEFKKDLLTTVVVVLTVRVRVLVQRGFHKDLNIKLLSSHTIKNKKYFTSSSHINQQRK